MCVNVDCVSSPNPYRPLALNCPVGMGIGAAEVSLLLYKFTLAYRQLSARRDWADSTVTDWGTPGTLCALRACRNVWRSKTLPRGVLEIIRAKPRQPQPLIGLLDVKSDSEVSDQRSAKLSEGS